MAEIITVSLDLAKNVFQVHGADSAGVAVLWNGLCACRCWRRGAVTSSKAPSNSFQTLFINDCADVLLGRKPKCTFS